MAGGHAGQFGSPSPDLPSGPSSPGGGGSGAEVDIRLSFSGGGDFTIDLAAPFTIKQSRGTDPYMFTLVLSKIDGFPETGDDGVPCSLKFSAPGESGGRAEIEWQLYLVRAEPSKAQKGLWNMVFGDERWKADYRRLTVSYNVQWPDGSYRDETVPGGAGKTGRTWLVVDALEDSITKLGFTPDISEIRKISPANKITVPNNLGNSDYGGYVDARWTEVLNPLLNAIGADLIIGLDRKWIVVPKQGDPLGLIDQLRGMKRFDDSVATGKNQWERPRTLKVGFEIMAEAVIESETSATSSGGTVFDVPENIMPRLTLKDLDPEAWWDDQNAHGVADTDWNEISDELATLGYLPLAGGQAGHYVDADQFIGQRWFLPNLIPIKRSGEFDEILENADPTLNAIAYQKKLWVDAALRATWRRVYRITFPQSGRSAEAANLRALSGIRFGRLTPGGDARSKGSVFCDWCEESVHALNFTGNPFDAKFSDNHPFSATRAAPFSARWLAQEGPELIFEIKPPEPSRIGQAKVLPGRFATPLTYGSWFSLSSDGYLQQLEMHGTIHPDFDFRLYLCGGLTTEDKRSGVATPYGEIINRHLVCEIPIPGHESGAIKTMELKSESMTANFGYTKQQMALSLGHLTPLFPSALLNENGIRELVRKMADRVAKQFELGNCGGIAIAGVSPIQQKIGTFGDIHEMSVVVGDPDPWSIVSQYIVMPGVPSADLEPKKRDGEKSALIAQE